MSKSRSTSSKESVTIITALIGVIGTIAVAYFAFRGTVAPRELEISATQTAESIKVTHTAENTPASETTVFPFEPIVYGFENSTDETDIAPWSPVNKSNKALISSDFFHSGQHSLKVFVDMQSFDNNKDIEYGGINYTDSKFLDVKMVTAWVFIPLSEPIQNTTFESHLSAYFMDDNGRSIGILSEVKDIRPGFWTPLFLGTFSETDNGQDNIVWNGKIDY